MTEFSTFIVSSKLNTIFFLVANYILGSLLLKVSEGRKADVEENTHKIIGMILVLLLVQNKATCELSRLYLEYRTRPSSLLPH